MWVLSSIVLFIFTLHTSLKILIEYYLAKFIICLSVSRLVIQFTKSDCELYALMTGVIFALLMKCL